MFREEDEPEVPEGQAGLLWCIASDTGSDGADVSRSRRMMKKKRTRMRTLILAVQLFGSWIIASH